MSIHLGQVLEYQYRPLSNWRCHCGGTRHEMGVEGCNFYGEPPRKYRLTCNTLVERINPAAGRPGYATTFDVVADCPTEDAARAALRLMQVGS